MHKHLIRCAKRRNGCQHQARANSLLREQPAWCRAYSALQTGEGRSRPAVKVLYTAAFSHAASSAPTCLNHPEESTAHAGRRRPRFSSSPRAVRHHTVIYQNRALINR